MIVGNRNFKPQSLFLKMGSIKKFHLTTSFLFEVSQASSAVSSNCFPVDGQKNVYVKKKKKSQLKNHRSQWDPGKLLFMRILLFTLHLRATRPHAEVRGFICTRKSETLLWNKSLKNHSSGKLCTQVIFWVLNSFRRFYPHFTDIDLECIKTAHMADLELVPVLVEGWATYGRKYSFHHKLFSWTSQSWNISTRWKGNNDCTNYSYKDWY